MISASPFGRKLALFRTASGTLGAVDARCPHLGADLGRGTVVDGTVRCPFHHWTFDRGGRCTWVPYADAPPPGVAVGAYPVVERYGIVWIYAGREADFALPLLTGEPLAKLPTITWTLACHHHLIVSNAFDLNHWRYVHGFDTRGSSPAEELGPHAVTLNLRLTAAVNRRIFRLARATRVDASVTLWGGNIAVIDVAIPWRCSILIAHRPRQRGGTRSFMVLGYPRRGLAYRLGAQFPEMLIKSALAGMLIGDDRPILNNIEFWPRLTKEDRALALFYQHVNRMPVLPE